MRAPFIYAATTANNGAEYRRTRYSHTSIERGKTLVQADILSGNAEEMNACRPEITITETSTHLTCNPNPLRRSD